MSHTRASKKSMPVKEAAAWYENRPVGSILAVPPVGGVTSVVCHVNIWPASGSNAAITPTTVPSVWVFRSWLIATGGRFGGGAGMTVVVTRADAAEPSLLPGFESGVAEVLLTTLRSGPVVAGVAVQSTERLRRADRQRGDVPRHRAGADRSPIGRHDGDSRRQRVGHHHAGRGRWARR